MTTIAVTGATGFVGRSIVKRALASGHKVLAFVRDPARVDASTNIQVVKWDATEDADPSQLKGVEVVCHAAAFVPSDMTELSAAVADRCFKVNVIGTVRLLQACEAAGVRRVVNFSTANAYASGNPRPQEEWPVYPSSRAPLYLGSKVAQEIVAEHWRRSGRLDTCTLRPSSVYGNGQTSGFIPTFIRQLSKREKIVVKNGGSFGADFVHVDDVASLAIQAFKDGRSGIFNVGSGRRVTVLEIVTLLLQELRVDPKLVAIDPADSDSDNGFPALDLARVTAAFDFKPRSVEAGIREQVQWCREHGDV